MKDIVYIVAGAGTGKTYTLTHNLMDRLKGGLEPREVIVTTFTRAAAQEIKTRAREDLLENGMVQQATQLDSAAIGTVHSVAQQFLNRFWYLTGSVPGQDVISEEDKRIYRNRSLAVMLEDGRFNNEKKAIWDYSAMFFPRHNDGVVRPYPEFWTEYLEQMTGKMEYYEITDVKYSLSQSKLLVDSIFNNPEQPDETMYQTIIDSLIHDAQAKVDGGGKVKTLKDDLKKYRNYKRTIFYPTLLNLHTIYSDPKKAQWLSNAATYCAILESWMRSTYFGKIINDCTSALFKLAQAWQREYSDYKKVKGLIDFDDMERGLLDLLDKPEVQEFISDNYKLVMVDEFQDSNPVQLRIFDRLSELVSRKSPLHPSSFWVGDPKQAIYGFRGSDSDLIDRVSRQFPVTRTELKKSIVPDNGTAGMFRAGLGISYRSCQELVRTANRVFKPLFPEMIELEADRKDNPKNQVAQWHFDDSEKDSIVSLARQIKSLGVPYGDIAVLVRKNRELNNIIKTFREEEVPVTCVEHDFLDRAEVQLLMSLLWLSEYEIDCKNKLRAKQHELASIMRLWNDMSTESVISDRLDYLANDRDKTEFDEWLKGDASLKLVKDVVKHSIGKSIDTKLAIFIHELDLNDKVRKWGERDVRRQNMKTMQKLAVQYSASCDSLGEDATVTGFVQYLNEANVRPVADMDTDTVKVCTYHGSKGLEWPWVFLLSFKDSDLDDDFVAHECWGVHELRKPGQEGSLYPEYYLNVFPAPYWEISCPFMERLEELTGNPLYESAWSRVSGEMARLLYVGFTRAKDHVVIQTFDKSETKWLERLGLTPESFTDGCVTFKSVNPKEPNAPEEPSPRARQATKDAYPGLLAEYKRKMKEYEQAMKVKAELEAERSRPRFFSCRDLPQAGGPFGKKYQQPSEMGKSDVPFTISRENIRPRFSLGGNDYISTVLGTCVHNAFAVCPDKVDDSPGYLDKVRGIIANYGMEKYLDKPEQLVGAISELYRWLTDKYGPSVRILHEYPFEFLKSEGLVIRGDIDLVWCTDKGCVIVDFKNYQGDEDVTNPSADHYAGHHYAAQLMAYRGILEDAGMKVLDTVLYYDILGDIVSIRQ